MIRIRSLLYNLFYGGRNSGYLRLLLIFLVTMFFMLLGRIAFEQIDVVAVTEGWVAHFPLLQVVPPVLLRLSALLFSGRFLRYLYLPLAAFIGALLLGARYVQDTYQLPRFRLALRYILATFIGVGYPILTISEGKKKIEAGEINLLELVGGPGYLRIKPGNVALIENLTGPIRVLSAGLHFISRSELIKDTASLDDQHGFIERVPATTKDGISIEVRDIHFRYRLRTGQPPGVYARRTPTLQYPFSVEAVRDMAYNRAVSTTGLAPWHTAVQSAVQGTITDHINQRRIDYLTAPSVEDGNPRLDIAELLNQVSTRERLRNLGVELLWCDIGHFDIPEPKPEEEEKFKDPRSEKWGAKWAGSAAVERAYGDAQRLALQERGRAEAQAEMLMSILSALNDIPLVGDPSQNLRNVIMVRTAQILEALTEKLQAPPASPRLAERSKSQLKPPRKRSS
ncbi:MAG TPA: SPFH domain-containing protein [Anaerolineales bacterium]|nr:SPFH domain-containing protein [Anaerolineales bacterium]